jgi:hypothetical protein
MRQCRLDQMPFANHIAVLWQARAAAGDGIRVEYEMLGEVQQRIAIENAVGVGAENQRVNRGIDACIERIGLAAGGAGWRRDNIP